MLIYRIIACIGLSTFGFVFGTTETPSNVADKKEKVVGSSHVPFEKDLQCESIDHKISY